MCVCKYVCMYVCMYVCVTHSLIYSRSLTFSFIHSLTHLIHSLAFTLTLTTHTLDVMYLIKKTWGSLDVSRSLLDMVISKTRGNIQEVYEFVRLMGSSQHNMFSRLKDDTKRKLYLSPANDKRIISTQVCVCFVCVFFVYICVCV